MVFLKKINKMSELLSLITHSLKNREVITAQ